MVMYSFQQLCLCMWLFFIRCCMKIKQHCPVRLYFHENRFVYVYTLQNMQIISLLLSHNKTMDHVIYDVSYLYFLIGLSFSGREFDDLSEEGQREACRKARYTLLIDCILYEYQSVREYFFPLTCLIMYFYCNQLL